MLIVAERLLVDVLEAIVKPTLPLPLPRVTPTVTHAAPLLADRTQPVPDVTLRVPERPPRTPDGSRPQRTCTGR